ncbi:MAG: hypothetical protein A2Y60_02970 [Chloroflexi bacterium RBG_13_54_9]|nr:MAG: hypothetical protein A2Y60_02970 [Chloroflexi bacterium RBG_13_54_9]
MAPGQATQDMTYDKPADETFADVQKALGTMGKVRNADIAALTIEGSSRYGLQSVKLKVNITPQGETSAISISAFSDDVWAAGAKNGIKRLQEAMANLGNADYVPSKTGVKPASMALRLAGFILVLLIVMAVLGWWSSGSISGRVVLRGVIPFIGFAILVYFIVARIRFGKK